MKTQLQQTLFGLMLLFCIHAKATNETTHEHDTLDWSEPGVKQTIQVSQFQSDGILEKINALATKLIKKAQSYGKYREKNSIKTHPYTTFAGDWEFREVEKLRNQIIASPVNKGYKRLWMELFAVAQESYSTDCGDNYKEECPNATIAKCAAFVYLIGLNSSGNAMMYETDRNSYKEKAVDILRNLDTDGRRFRGNLMQMERSFELICYLQAYDYIAYKDQASDDDIEVKLHKFTYELYSHANNYITLNFDKLSTLDDDPGAGSLRRYNNQSIIAASAIGMAAIVLNNKGAFFWQRQRKPDRWAAAAHAYINSTMFTYKYDKAQLLGFTTGAGVPYAIPYAYGANADRGSVTGYAEGPHYFRYSFSALLPFMRSFNNFIRDNPNHEEKYAKSFLDNFTKREKVKNYLHDPDYDKLYDWYCSLYLPSGEMPSYDDSPLDFGLPLAITMKPQYNIQPVSKLDFLPTRIRLEVDFLGVMPEALNVTKPLPDVVHMPKAGNIIVRSYSNVPKTNNKHYILALAENGYAVNGAKPADFGHEHADATSFIIVAGDDQLIIDPPYYGFENRHNINSGYHHNLITNGNDADGGPNYRTSALSTVPITIGSETHFTIASIYNGLGINRHFSVSNDNINIPSYTIFDRVGKYNLESPLFSYLQIPGISESDMLIENVNLFLNNQNVSNIYNNIQGNGETRNGTFVHINNNSIVYKQPCFREDRFEVADSNNWKVRVTMSVFKRNATTNTVLNNDFEYHKHGTKIGNLEGQSPLREDFRNITTHVEGIYGDHTRFAKSVEIGVNDSAYFLTTIEPMTCDMADDYNLPIVFQTANNTYHIRQILDPNGLLRELKYASFNNGFDTIINPFGLSHPINAITDANTMILRHSDTDLVKSGYCVTYTNFRYMEIGNGKLARLNDTTYIESDKVTNCGYAIKGKYEYTGFSENLDSSSTVRFFIPDLAQGIQMVCRDKNFAIIPSTHSPNDSTYRFIEITFPPGVTEFKIEPEDPCAVSCFFPPTYLTIDSTFDFNTGTLERLGHDLDIVTDSGYLLITNGSKMSICPDFILVNQDSLIMKQCVLPLSDATIYPHYTEYGENSEPISGTSIGGNNSSNTVMSRMADKKRNLIIINDKAALVLDSGSYTQIGTYSTIIVRKGGTLLIKNGATLVIGDKCEFDRGELIAEDGSFVCVEAGADMHFFEDVDSSNYVRRDTIDRHIVYISMNSSPVNPSLGANASCNTSGGDDAFTTDPSTGLPGRWEGANCTAFCSWKVVNPPHGVNNRKYGWCNISFPVSRFTSVDTICPLVPYHINASKSLNETGYEIFVCKYDTLTGNCISPYTTIRSIDTSRLGSSEYVCQYTQTGHYQVRLMVENDCGERDTSYKVIYVPPLPIADLQLPDSACPGVGTVIANGVDSRSWLDSIEHIWTVALILPDSAIQNNVELHYGGDWVFTSTEVDSQFNFPDFRWVGGFKYAVGLTVNGWCGSVTTWDTISIPLKVFINANASIVYNNPIGPAALQLQGEISGATNWHWLTADYLNDSTILNPIATPPDSTIIVLMGVSNECAITDTLFIKHNNHTFAGIDHSVCYDKPSVLGSSYNGYLLLALLLEIDEGQFSSSYDASGSSQYHKYFTHFMFRNYNGFNCNILDVFDQAKSLQDTVFKRQYFKDLYDEYYLLGNDQVSNIQDLVDELRGDSWVYNYINSNLRSQYINCSVSDILNEYDNWLNNTQNYEITWESKLIDDTVWTEIPNTEDFFNIYVSDTITKQYRITAIDNLNSIVEFDEVTIERDSNLFVMFYVGYQTDSTVYFNNATNPIATQNIHNWNFGDGSTSNFIHPMHVFAAYDTSFLVCLTVTNSCTTDTYCDTIYLDSFSSMNSNRIVPSSQVLETIGENKKSIAKGSNNSYLSINYPNPFDDWTIIEYSIGSPIKVGASIEINSMEGKWIQSIELQHPNGIQMIHANGLAAGVYYYKLVVDGVVQKYGKMIVHR